MKDNNQVIEQRKKGETMIAARVESTAERIAMAIKSSTREKESREEECGKCKWQRTQRDLNQNLQTTR